MSLQNLAHVCSHLQNTSRARLAQTSITLTKLHLAVALALQKQGFISTVEIGGVKPPLPPHDTILPKNADFLTFQQYTRLVNDIRQSPDAALQRLEPWTWTSKDDTDPSKNPPLLSEAEYNQRPWLLSISDSSTGRIPLNKVLANPSLLVTSPSLTLLSHELWQTRSNSLAHGFQSSSSTVLAEEPWRAYPDPHPFFHQTGIRPSPDPWVKIPQNPAERRLWLGLKYFRNEPVISTCSVVSKGTRRVNIQAPEIAKLVRGNRGKSSKGVLVKGLTSVGECMFFRTDIGILEARECLAKKRGGFALCRVG